jgi:hypothetical protein
VVEDEVEAEVERRHALGLLAQAAGRGGQRLTLVDGDERHEAGEPRAGGGERGGLPVVVLRTDVQVAVDEPGEDDLPGGVDHAVGRWQERLGGDGRDPPVLDGHRRLEVVGRGDHAAAADDEVDAARSHRCGSFSMTGWSRRP